MPGGDVPFEVRFPYMSYQQTEQIYHPGRRSRSIAVVVFTRRYITHGCPGWKYPQAYGDLEKKVTLIQVR